MKPYIHLRTPGRRQERLISLHQVCWVNVVRNSPASPPEVDVTFAGGGVLHLDGPEGEEFLRTMTGPTAAPRAGAVA